MPKETTCTHFCFSISSVNVNVFLSKFHMTSTEYTVHSCNVNSIQLVSNISTGCSYADFAHQSHASVY